MHPIETLIGHAFADQKLFKLALTHASASGGRSYERLEFLGDRVLGMAVADILYTMFPNDAEGPLARRLSALVQGETLSAIAQEINLSQYIQLSENERDNQHILADVLEAILGALYLDAGYPECQRVITQLWGTRFKQMTRPPQHPKTSVQEWAQAKGLTLPTYEIIRQSGPDHAPLFDVQLTVETFPPIVEQGRSRQEAEKKAAITFMQDKS